MSGPIKSSDFNQSITELPQLGRVPTLQEIQNMIDVAAKSRVRVQQSWICGGGVELRKFELAVGLSKDPADAVPRWAFYKTVSEEQKVEWAYATPDVSLIHNMLLCTFADEVLTPEAHSSYAYNAAQSSNLPVRVRSMPGAPRPEVVDRWAALDEADQSHRESDPAQAVRQKLTQAGTGLYSHAAFMFFLQTEFSRYQSYHRPFSIILLSLKRDRENPVEIKNVVIRIRRIKAVLRSSDLMCHFEGSGFALILPETDAVAVRPLVKSIVDELNKHLFDSAQSSKALWVKIGVASVPADCETLPALITVALRSDRSSVIVLR
jgi:diguanylate cyclase (GGDEF)-like protein